MRRYKLSSYWVDFDRESDVNWVDFSSEIGKYCPDFMQYALRKGLPVINLAQTESQQI